MNYFGFTWPIVLLGAGVVLVVGILVAWGVIALERRNRQESRAERIQTVVTHAIAGDSAMAGASILPVASLRTASDRPTLELTGSVPSEAARRRAIELTDRALASVRPGMHVVDRLEVVPSLAQQRGA
ncbi:MAG TPA: BON domain-containing protein [Methylomirabilota bacterium]|nr:BON domain-containing protein [Methylomirabilota bacterium]